VTELGQLASPDKLSLPFQLTVTGFRYQPFGFGPGSALGDSTGAVASYFSAKEVDADGLPALSVQLPLRVVPPLSGPL
jgi:hypothetical protein